MKKFFILGYSHKKIKIIEKLKDNINYHISNIINKYKIENNNFNKKLKLFNKVENTRKNYVSCMKIIGYLIKNLLSKNYQNSKFN